MSLEMGPCCHPGPPAPVHGGLVSRGHHTGWPEQSAEDRARSSPSRPHCPGRASQGAGRAAGSGIRVQIEADGTCIGQHCPVSSLAPPAPYAHQTPLPDSPGSHPDWPRQPLWLRVGLEGCCGCGVVGELERAHDTLPGPPPCTRHPAHPPGAPTLRPPHSHLLHTALLFCLFCFGIDVSTFPLHISVPRVQEAARLSGG